MQKEITIEATGEKIRFLKTAAATEGTYVETLCTLPASGKGPRAHRHVFQTEYFEAIEGNLGLECEGKKIVLKPGESFTVPRNALHRCFSADGTEVHFKAVFTPALSIEYFLTEMFESSNRNKAAEPSTFDACYMIRQTNDEYYLGGFSVFFQRRIFPLIIAVGKCFRLIKARPNPACANASADKPVT